MDLIFVETFFQELLTAIFNDGNPGIRALLILAVMGLGFLFLKRESAHAKERKEVVDSFQKQIEHDREELFKILDKYQEGQLSVVQAMNEIKVLIATIGAKL
jgi:hypothetical protein